ncbi:MAG: DUF3088 family protein [Pseudomonadota bacterium]
MRDTLYLLAPDIFDRGRREYCPECAEMWGVLSYYPFLRETVEIVYEPIAHPRPGIVAALGEGEWNCPTLVLADDAPTYDAAPEARANGKRYFKSARAIGRYFAHRYGTAFPRGFEHP